MRDRLLALFAFALFTGFVGILVWRVPSPDLMIVVAVTTLLAGYDLFRSHGRRGS